jgi:hypothetical protein
MSYTNTTEASRQTIFVDAARYLDIAKPERVLEQLNIELTGHCFLPRIDDLESDWIAHVTAPAFKVYCQQRGEPVASFCSIGTGSGLDVLSAIELLGASRVGLTDVHEDVVSAAAANVRRNHNSHHALTVEAGFGDLLTPLIPYGTKYDIIYENLPNISTQSAEEVAADKNSSAFVPPRTETVPPLIRQQMLDLHYIALTQARDFLEPGGAILSCLGARVPLSSFLELSRLAGYQPSFLTYGWKVQADPELIRDYGRKEKLGFGPFYFYRAEVLQKTFAGLEPAEAGKNALDIERLLQNRRMDPATAFAAFEDGESIAHTVAVLKSELRP